MCEGIPRVKGDRKDPQGLTQSSEDNMSISNSETGEKGRQRARTGPHLEDVMWGRRNLMPQWLLQPRVAHITFEDIRPTISGNRGKKQSMVLIWC